MRRTRLLLPVAILALLGLLLVWLRPRPPVGTEPPAASGASAARPEATVPDAPPAPSVLPAPADAPVPRGAFEGRVLSLATGTGAPGAEVTFSRGGAAASVRCQPDGTFRFEPPEPGRWQLATASAPGHVPFAPEWGHSPVVLEARPGEQVRGLSIHLVPLAAWTGRVEDPSGSPVEGAEVRVVGGAAGNRALVPSGERAVSGPGGAFALSAPEDATLEARHPGFAPGRPLLDLVARSAHRVVIRLGQALAGPGAGTIGGRVLSGGSPVEGALVSARLLLGGGPGSAEEPVAAQALSDAEGRFTLRDVGPGRHLLVAAREGLTQARPVVARAGEEATVELSRGGTLAGIVRDDLTGRPLPAFRVEVRRGRGFRLPAGALTVVDASGRFSLPDLPPGPVAVLASAPGHLPAGPVETTVPEHPGVAEVELRLGQGGRVWGRVLDRASGLPLPGARVALEGLGGSDPGLLDPGTNAVTGPDGVFQVSGLPVRTISLHVSADGHHARIVTRIDVPERGAAGPVEVKLTPVADGEEPRIELAGIGAALRPEGRSALRITGVVPGGGAAEAGLSPGDDVLAVEGRPVSELGLSGAVDLIRGPEDTRVRLTVRRGEAPPWEAWVWRRLVRG